MGNSKNREETERGSIELYRELSLKLQLGQYNNPSNRGRVYDSSKDENGVATSDTPRNRFVRFTQSLRNIGLTRLRSMSLWPNG